MIGLLLLLIAMLLVVKFCKGASKIVLSIIIILVTLYCVMISIDINRVKSFREPIFNISWYEETGLIEYNGIGYRTIVRYGYTGNNVKEISSIEMYMFDKCIAKSNIYISDTTEPYIPEGINVTKGNEIGRPEESIEYNRKPQNVTIEVIEETISNTSVEILITDNNEDKYGWGVDFRVQEKIDEEWEDLEYISDDVSWIAIGYFPNGGNQLTLKVNIEEYYGKLDKGIYRIVKQVYDNGHIDIYSNEFEIK